MPSISASYEGTTVIGYNAGERPFGQTTPPSVAISQYAEPLFKLMEGLKNEGDRSAYACAEAQALSMILASKNGLLDFDKIEFGRPTSDSEKLLWNPCRNCSAWLEQKSGWGPSVKYKLAAAVVELLSPKVKAVNTGSGSYDTNFPPLGGGKL